MSRRNIKKTEPKPEIVDEIDEVEEPVDNVDEIEEEIQYNVEDWSATDVLKWLEHHHMFDLVTSST